VRRSHDVPRVRCARTCSCHKTVTDWPGARARRGEGEGERGLAVAIRVEGGAELAVEGEIEGAALREQDTGGDAVDLGGEAPRRGAGEVEVLARLRDPEIDDELAILCGDGAGALGDQIEPEVRRLDPRDGGARRGEARGGGGVGAEGGRGGAARAVAGVVAAAGEGERRGEGERSGEARARPRLGR
jgi:hypothetical protein